MRIAPDEVHVNDPAFLDTIYASSPHKREKERARNLEISLSVAGTANYELHKLRHDALNPFFSKRAVAHMIPMVTGKARQVEGLSSRVHRAAGPGESLRHLLCSDS